MAKRNTPAKQRIREALLASTSAVSQDMLEAQLQGQVDRVTIYRVLASFCEDGFLHRVLADDGKSYYARCTDCTEARHRHDHPHFRCEACRRVECLPGAVAPRLPQGYSAHAVNYWISGRCPACAGA